MFNEFLDKGQALPNTLEKKQFLLKRQILAAIYSEKAVVIPAIAKKIGLSIPSVHKLIKELLDQGFIINNGRQQASLLGRKPFLYSFNSQAGYLVAIEVCKVGLSGVVFNLTGSEVYSCEDPDFRLVGNSDALNYIVRFAQQFEQNYAPLKGKNIAFGFALPGLTNYSEGKNYSYFESINLKKELIDRLGNRVFFDNDARLIAYGEYVAGCVQGVGNCICLNLSEDIGMGLIINHQLYGGSSGMAGELGHIQCNTGGELCYCGKTGCLETLASGNALVKQVSADILKGVKTLLPVTSPSEVHLQAIINAALAGDVYSISLFQQSAQLIGKSIAMLIHLLNPEAIVLGGKLSAVGHYMLPAISEAIDKHTLSRIAERTRILVSTKGELSCLYGIYAQCMQQLFVNAE